MAYMRGQHNVPYAGHYTQRGSRSQRNLPATQPQVNQFSGTYSWGSMADQAGSTAWVKRFEKVDYSNYESTETQPQEGYEQAEPAGNEEGYGSLWQGRGGGANKKWQGPKRGGGGGERQWQEEGRDKSGSTLWRGEGEDGSGLHWQGQGRGGLRGEVGTHRPGQGRGKSRTPHLNDGEDDSGLHWQSQGRGSLRGGVGIHGPGQRRGSLKGNVHTYGPEHGRGRSGTLWLDQGGEGSNDGGFQGQDEGEEQAETQWLDQEVDKGGFQWQDKGGEQGETQWLYKVVDRRGKGRDVGGFQWQDEREEQGETQWHDQGRDDSGFQWPGGRENSGSRWQNQGEDNIDAQWQGQGNITGFGRLRGSRKRVGPGINAVDRMDVTSDAPGFEDDSYADVDFWSESGQKGTYLSNVVVEYYGSSTYRGGIGRGGYPDIGSSARGGEGRGGRGMVRGANMDMGWVGRGGRGMVRVMNTEVGYSSVRGGGAQGGRGLGRGVNMEVARGGWGPGKGGGRGRPFQSSSSVDCNNTTGQTSEEESENQLPEGGLARLIQKWMTFTKKFVDCGNAISNVECSLTSSKVHALSMDFDCKFLAKCGNHSVFTAVLKIVKKSNSSDIPVESVFLARSQGLNKKTAKLNCYEEAYKILRNSTVEAIMKQKDIDEKDLRQQVQLNYSNNPDEFMETLKGMTSSNLDIKEESEQPQEVKKESPNKRSSSASAAVPAAKKPRNTDYTAEIILNKQLSLVPTKKLDVLMNPADPLVEKLEMLKKLLKEEGITKLHIVPKVDQLAYKSAILIQNVYRLEDVARSTFGSTEVYCEIYFDDVYMTRGSAQSKKHAATQQAYSNLAGLLYSKPLNVLANNPRLWNPFMALELDVHHVVTKWHGKDSDSLLTNNLSNMKQMMQSMPDVTIPIEQMVLTLHESDRTDENMFKVLELSATRNLMLLECEIMRNPDLTFICTLSMQGKILARTEHASKNTAKRLCSEIVMNKLKQTQDIIYVKTGMVGITITKDDLLLSAMKKKALGEPPGKIFKKMPDYSEDASEENGNGENLLENVKARPLYPWIAAAMYEVLDEYYQKITLEDLMLDLEGMPKSQLDIVYSCAAKMGLRKVTKTKQSYMGPLLRRTVTAQEMDKILQLHGGESGRYQLVSCRNHLTKGQLHKFKKHCLEEHKKLVEARTHDSPEEDPEHLLDLESQLEDSGSSDNKIATFTHHQQKSSTGNHPQQAKDTSMVPLSHTAPRAPQYSAYRPIFEPRIPAPLGLPPPLGMPRMPYMLPGFRPLMDPYMFRNPFNRH